MGNGSLLRRKRPPQPAAGRNSHKTFPFRRSRVRYPPVRWETERKRSNGIALAVLALVMPLHSAPLRLLAIGDSLTEEYRFESPFSAPDSDPLVANARNWVELLHARRPLGFTMGNYQSTLGSYADFRNAGYEYNYGVPGFKAQRWDELLYRQYSLSELLIPENAFSISTRVELKSDLSAVDAVLVFVGGNDLSLANSDAQHDTIRQHIIRIHSYVRANAPSGMPIIIATIPDIGATPQEKLSDPAASVASRQRVATLNANIAAMDSLPHTHIARIDAITDRIFDQQPFHLNGTLFAYPPDPENPPRHLFCKDGFHAGTVTQALIANEILKAINTFSATPIPLFTNREILADILGQNPDQPLIDYLGCAPDDGDALPGLIEYLLGSDPTTPDAAFTFSADGTASYAPSETALRFADLYVLQSATLGDDWIPVPAQNIQTLPDGTVNLIPSAPILFYKFAATPKP
jgi:lysophospholipase L1-like esterase